ncbi:hypothetical protein JYU34_011981 [Plutella xylostella]|uniref:Uncharacterized protein n=1 Tax=Plutella xylostella TaxID=51655 RepID=A0ABQ7QE09_PLUXY|nr:hypothetical protein JYU34_011981 [Plutella xylostella]
MSIWMGVFNLGITVGATVAVVTRNAYTKKGVQRARRRREEEENRSPLSDKPLGR